MSITKKQLNQLKLPEYIGDGVYVKYDGLHIAISVGDHRNEPVVYLEDYVMHALAKFSERKYSELRALTTEETDAS